MREARCLLHLPLDVLLGGLDLDLAVAPPGPVGGLGEDGRGVDDRAIAQIEARLGPGADHGVPLTVPLLEGSSEVAADAGDGAHLTTRSAAEQDRSPLGLDPAHGAF